MVNYGSTEFGIPLYWATDYSTDCASPLCSNCAIEKADRGRFYRLHQHCISEYSDCATGEDSFVLILVYATVCGIFWFTAGALSCQAYAKNNRLCIMIAASLFIIGYVIFVGIFGNVMFHVNYANKIMKPLLCPKVFDKFKRSGNEFKAYSICSFILIFISIVCTLLPLYKLKFSGGVTKEVQETIRMDGIPTVK